MFTREREDSELVDKVYLKNCRAVMVENLTAAAGRFSTVPALQTLSILFVGQKITPLILVQ